jgi:hypothetical protein
MPEKYGTPPSAENWDLSKSVEEQTNIEGKYFSDNSLTASQQVQADFQALRDDYQQSSQQSNESVESVNNEEFQGQLQSLSDEYQSFNQDSESTTESTESESNSESGESEGAGEGES